jgi:hypothetical protein
VKRIAKQNNIRVKDCIYLYLTLLVPWADISAQA